MAVLFFMKTRIFILFSLFILYSFSYAAPKKKDNTFVSVIQNNSDFTITLDDETVASGSHVKHFFPLYEGDLYDSWNVQYEISLTDNISYLLNDKVFIPNNQKIIIIENPKNNKESECYVIIQNNSNDTFQITDSRKNKIYPCYNNGFINDRNCTPVYNIPPQSVVVCPVEDIDLYAVNDTNLSKAKLIDLNTPFKKGYVYTLELTSKKSTLIDCRPLQNVQEKLWNKEFTKETIRSIKNKGEEILLLGTSSVKDNKKNLYNTGFLQSIQSNGNENWKVEYAVPGTDTYLYDMTIVSDGSILIVGQSIVSDMRGLILQYSAEGDLLQNISVPETIGLELIIPLNNGNYILRGYNENGNVVYLSLNTNGNYSLIKNPFNSTQTENLIQSESKYVEDKNGNFYIAGETSYLERPVATVIFLSKEGGCKALYTAREPFSFVSDMLLDESENRLIIVGTQNASDSTGNDGTPFIRCINLQTKEVLWENLYFESGYEVCARIASCDNYGFVQLLVNADEDGNIMLPCKILRSNTTGKQ